MDGEDKIRERQISHGEILKKIWKNLDLGVIDRDHPFHAPVFATVCENAPNLRTVVLRRFWRKLPRLAFHTDFRSPKIKEIESNPNVYWLFYHPQERFQVRVSGIAEIDTRGELAEEQWMATEMFSRRCYIAKAPSSELERPEESLPAELTERAPTREESEQGRANFAVVSMKIKEIDCLEMKVRGHRRSLFTWDEAGEMKTKWLAP